MFWLHALAVVPSLWLGNTCAQNAAFPQRALQIIVPYSTGTTADILARTLGQRLAERWKVSVVTDNRPGATAPLVPRQWPKPHPMAIPCSLPLLRLQSSLRFIPASRSIQSEALRPWYSSPPVRWGWWYIRKCPRARCAN